MAAANVNTVDWDGMRGRSSGLGIAAIIARFVRVYVRF
jgi:hypothetical protein